MRKPERSRPLVSLCIPTFNRVELLKKCVESARCQTYQNIEIVVSDNFSTDGTKKYLENLSDIKINYHTTNVGMVANWNSLLKLANGVFCVLLSDDDILDPRFVETLVVSLEEFGCAFSYTAVTIIDGDGKTIGEANASPARESVSSFVKATLDQKRVPYPSAILFRAADAKAIGYFKDIGNQTDVAFRIALAELHPNADVIAHSTPLVKYRIHASSLTDDPEKRAVGRKNFQAWVASRYTAASLFGQMAIFDLLNLKSKKYFVDASCFPFGKEAVENNFSKKVERFLLSGEISRSKLYLAFPMLASRHIMRLLFNRIYHKRFGKKIRKVDHARI